MIHARDDYNKRIQVPDNVIPSDEPVFLLRAQDPDAAKVVRFWSRLHLIRLMLYEQKLKFKNGKLTKEDRKQLDRLRAMNNIAMEHAALMEQWRPKKKIADMGFDE